MVQIHANQSSSFPGFKPNYPNTLFFRELGGKGKAWGKRQRPEKHPKQEKKIKMDVVDHGLAKIAPSTTFATGSLLEFSTVWWL